MKKYWLESLLVCAALCCGHIEAQIRPGPNSFGCEVEFLYVKPVLDFSYYAMPTTSNTLTLVSGTRHANLFDFHGGYAIGGVYVFCNEEVDLRLKWTHFQETARDNVASNVAMNGTKVYVLGTGVVLDASSVDKLKYDTIDFLVGYIPIHRCRTLSLHAGLQYAKVSYDEEDLFTNPNNLVFNWSLKAEGVGPEVGLLCKYLIPTCSPFPDIYLDAKLQLGTVIAKMSSNASFEAIVAPPVFPGFFDTSNESTYRVVPFWDVALGMSSQCSFHCLTLEFEIGYECIHYRRVFDGIGLLNFLNAAPSRDFYSDLLLHGLYFSAGITY